MRVMFANGSEIVYTGHLPSSPRIGDQINVPQQDSNVFYNVVAVLWVLGEDPYLLVDVRPTVRPIEPRKAG